MSRRLWWTCTGGLFTLLAVLAVVAALWGPDGLELVSWLAGAAGLVVAVVALVQSVSSSATGESRPERAPGPVQIADAGGEARIQQAGRDIRNV